MHRFEEDTLLRAWECTCGAELSAGDTVLMYSPPGMKCWLMHCLACGEKKFAEVLQHGSART